MEHERVSLDTLELDPNNSRTHPPENRAAIAASLGRFGQVEPLVCNRANRRVVGGNGRLLVMRALGWREADVVWVDLTEAQASALGIALNRTAEMAAWDEGILARVIARVKESGEVEPEVTGFTREQVAGMLTRLGGGTAAGPAPTGAPAEATAGAVAGPKAATAPGEFRSYGENDVPTDTVCPRCGFAFDSGAG